MNIFDSLIEAGYGELHLKRDNASGLCAMIAIHDCRRGPALGGCRFLTYASEEDAIYDVLRLARAMTYKAAISDLRFGGGKSVILRPSGAFDRPGLFRAFGRFIGELGGRYIVAEDSGTSLTDMEVIRTVTPHVTSMRQEHGGSGGPSPFTAIGVRRAIEASVRYVLGRDSLKGIRVAVQGIGHVGYCLCRELSLQGALITATDVEPSRLERVQNEFAAKIVPADAIFAEACDVFAPCALGGVLNDTTIAQLRCSIVAGAANNQLKERRHGEALRSRGIFYAPDYAANAGGLICVAQEVEGYDEGKVLNKVHRIYDVIYEIAKRAEGTAHETAPIADAMAEQMLRVC